MSNRRKTTAQFIYDARKVHGDRYDYSLVEYKTNKTKVKIVCSEHGVFEQCPSHHLRGQACRKCKNLYSPTTEEWIERAQSIHQNRYIYSQVEYKNCKTKVRIGCREHGEFEQTPTDHLQGKGCPVCGGSQVKTTEQFIEDAKRIHGNRYCYSRVDYKNNKTKVKIVCSEHGVFEQSPDNHIRGCQGCPKCAATKPEKDIMNYFQELKIPFSYNWSFPGSRYRYDFMIPFSPIPLLIEFDGRIHFKFSAHFHQSEEKYDLKRAADIKKTKLAVEKGYHILRIHHKHADEIPELLDFALEHMATYDTADVFIVEDEDYSYITDNL